MENQNSHSSSSPRHSSNGLKIVLFFLLAIGIIAGSAYTGFQFGKKQIEEKLPEAEKKPVVFSPTLLPTGSSVTDTPSSDWKTAKYGGLFSYEYPAGWHVAELWQQNSPQNGNTIAIDPNPINTSPRGGPLATFEITLISGNDNPDQILSQRMSNFNEENYSDIKKETLNAPIGEIYHYKGKIVGEMLGGEPVENYFFTFNQNPKDPINQVVVIASLSLKDDPKLSEMLRHIVFSFKKITR